MPFPLFPISGDIIAQARKESNIGPNPISSALQDDAMYQRLQDIEEEGVSYPASVGVLGWSFLDAEVVISTVDNTTLNGAVSKGATSMVLTDGSNFDLGSDVIGGGYIKSGTQVHDFFTYETGTGGTTISGVNDVSVNHLTAEEVHKIYLLPTNFGYPRALYRQSVYFQYQSMDAAMRQVPAHPFYFIKYLTSANQSGLFIIFPYKIGVLTWTMLYQKKAVNIESAADKTNVTLSLPKGHGRRYYIEKLKEYIFDDEGDEMQEQASAAKAQDHINKLLDEYGLQEMAGQQNSLFLAEW